MNFRLWLEDREFRHSKILGLKPDAPVTEVNGVKFVKPPRAEGDVVVMTDIKKFDEAWGRDRNFYIPPGGGRNAIGNRYEQFIDFLSMGQPIVMPEVSMWEGMSMPAFTNGRHRYCVLRDKGWEKMPMCVDPDTAPEFRELYEV